MNLNNDNIRKKIYIAIIVDMIIFVFALMMGRYKMDIRDIIIFCFAENKSDIIYNIIINLRMPRTIVAFLVGIALSLSGAIYQAIFNNKLVSPDLLGVSSGASVGACIAILCSFSKIIISGTSFFFGLIAVFLSMLIAKVIKKNNNIILLLSGIVVAGLMSSMVGLIKYLADNDRKLAEMTYWLLGDFSNVNMIDAIILSVVDLVCLFICKLFLHQINAITLGDKEAITVGLNYYIIVMVLVVCATLMTATSVAIAGMIGWVGLSIPNIVRIIFGNDNRKVFCFSVVFGGGFMILVDVLSRSFTPNEIPISVITGIMGTPIFIISIIKNKKEIE